VYYYEQDHAVVRQCCSQHCADCHPPYTKIPKGFKCQAAVRHGPQAVRHRLQAAVCNRIHLHHQYQSQVTGRLHCRELSTCHHGMITSQP
jgi:hypothetical protein